MSFREDASAYHSGSQIARVWTEGWYRDWGFCPRCGGNQLAKAPNNAEARDFECRVCEEGYELKSTKGRIGSRIVDGAHGAMMRRLESPRSPSLLVLRYDRARQQVVDMIGVPRQFFVPQIIEERKPLASGARRAGWVGCNILLGQVPASGKVAIVTDGRVESRETVVARWNATGFLRGRDLAARGWLLATMRCVEAVAEPGGTFTLSEIYAFEAELAQQFPGNANIRPKLRQQLQVLRDAGAVAFLGGGTYRRIGN